MNKTGRKNEGCFDGRSHVIMVMWRQKEKGADLRLLFWLIERGVLMNYYKVAYS